MRIPIINEKIERLEIGLRKLKRKLNEKIRKSGIITGAGGRFQIGISKGFRMASCKSAGK